MSRALRINLTMAFLSFLAISSCGKAEPIEPQNPAPGEARELTDAAAKDTADLESGEVTFQEYISTLETLEFPVVLDLNSSVEIDEYNKDGFRKYRHPWAAQPFGIMHNDGDYVGIIDISIGDQGPVPLLTVYDSEGTTVDATSFFKKSQWYLGYFASEQVIIQDS